MKILIGADLVPTKRNADLFSDAKTEELLGLPLKELLNSASYRIFNLEVPLTDKESPIEKCGPCLRAGESTIVGIKDFGVDFLTLANNHILDHGEQGLFSTMKLLDDAGIAYAGAGRTPAEASRAHIATVEGVKIGIYCCAEHEFTIVTKESAGANPYDPLESFDCVKELRQQCDLLIVLYHGGKEYCRYPSPEVRRLCKKFVDCGADAVICQHTHCIGCEENYTGKKIVYGQGNFLFDDSEKAPWQTSLLLECEVNADGIKFKYHPLRKDQNKVRLATPSEASEIMEAFQLRSNELLSDDVWKKRYSEFACSSYEQLLFRVNGELHRTFVFRALARLFGKKFYKYYFKKCYGKNALLVLRNTVESESWRELLIEAINSNK